MDNKKIGYKDVFKQKEYLKLILANVINRFGDSVDMIAFEWMVYMLTGSGTWTALIFGVNKIPTIFLQPLAGAAIDKMNKKRVMVATDLIRGFTVAYTALSFYWGFLTPWMLIIVTLVISSAEAFRIPCGVVVVPRLLTTETLEYGISLSSSIGTVVEMIGMAAGAGIIAAFGVSTAIGIDAATFFGSALVILTIKIKEDIKKGEAKGSNYGQLLKEGGKYAVENKTVFQFLILALLCNALFVPINALQAPMVSEVLKSDAVMLSVYSISMMGGILVSTVIYPMVSSKLNGKMIIAVVGIVFGSYHIALTLVGAFIVNEIVKYVAVAALSAFTGFTFTFLSMYVNTIFFKVVDEEYFARTAAIMNSSGTAAMPVVSFVISFIAARVATGPIFIGTGIVSIAVMLVLAATYKEKTVQESIEVVNAEVEEKSEIA